MRLPNGYGSVFKLSGRRRRPYIARKTVGYTESGKQIYSVIGYYETKEEALTALANYNQQDIPEPSITLAKVYQLWYPIHARQVSSSTATSYKNSYNHLAKISAMPIAKIKYRHLQEVLDTMRSKGLSYASLKKVRPHKTFTRQQINRVWQCKSVDTDLTLILLYTGMRVGELLQLKKSNVNLKQKYFDIVTSKTKSGIRIIPIHPLIFPIVERKMREDKRAKYLFVNPDLTQLTYSQAATQFAKTMQAIRAKHSTHDCRHTVATLLDAAGANKVARDRLLGHASSNVGDSVYTHKTLTHLRKVINLLK